MNKDLIEIKPAENTDVANIKDLAYKTWFHSYGQILSQEQIVFMLNELYDEAVLAELMKNKSQQFIILYQNNLPKGFAAYGITSDSNTKLYKIYVLPECQGLGFGKILINWVKEKALFMNCEFLELNVNRYNDAISFYEKMGFAKIREIDVPIGPYWMNDYIMRLPLK